MFYQLGHTQVDQKYKINKIFLDVKGFIYLKYFFPKMFRSKDIAIPSFKFFIRTQLNSLAITFGVGVIRR